MPDNVVVTREPSRALEQFLNEKKYSQIAVLVDEKTAEHCYPLISKSMPPHHIITVQSGEKNKNIRTCETIWQAMTDYGLDRRSALVVLGGGVLGDMGGFCAATYKRGVDFILIPTTLLSQVDASIGGKLGIDFQQLKNHIGVFKFPALTMLHSGFIKTLPIRELRSGFAEVIKHALISDASMWARIRETPFDKQDWEELIMHSLNFKRRIVSEDPQECGIRKILNAGHTIGHAIESYLLGTARGVLHGEAIAAGLIAESFIANERGLLGEDDLSQITEYVKGVFGKIALTVNDDHEIAGLTLQDKKNLGNRILCVLLDGIGKARWDCEISTEEVKRALAFYRSR